MQDLVGRITVGEAGALLTARQVKIHRAYIRIPAVMILLLACCPYCCCCSRGAPEPGDSAAGHPALLLGHKRDPRRGLSLGEFVPAGRAVRHHFTTGEENT